MSISNRNIQSKVPLSGETPEVDAIIREAMRHHHNDLISMAEFLYQLANEKLVGCFLETLCLPLENWWKMLFGNSNKIWPDPLTFGSVQTSVLKFSYSWRLHAFFQSSGWWCNKSKWGIGHFQSVQLYGTHQVTVHDGNNEFGWARCTSTWNRGMNTTREWIITLRCCFHGLSHVTFLCT